MKIKNRTNYDTQYLRRLFIACEKHEGTNHRYREVEVLNKRGGGVSGRAWVNSRYVNMYLPIGRGPGFKPKSHSVARVYIHEVSHNLGLRHKDMASISSIDVSWLADEPIPKKPKPPKPKPNVVEVRAIRAQAKLDEWQKKLIRAKTFVKKYQRKVRYYQRKTAASPENRKEAPSAID